MESNKKISSAAWVAACLLLAAAIIATGGVANAATDAALGGAAAWSASGAMTAAWRTTLEDAVEPELLHGVQGLILLSSQRTAKGALDSNHPVCLKGDCAAPGELYTGRGCPRVLHCH
jgi:hypothetical protein